MEKRLVCEVLNTEDRKAMTISSEWFADETIKVIVMREGTIPLCGQTTVDQQLQGYPRTNVLREQAINEMQDELSGKDTRAQFVLRDSKLSWKMKAWWKGCVKLEAIEDMVTFADMSRKWLNEEASWRRMDAERMREGEALRRNNLELIGKLDSLEASKKRMEDILYTRFLSVLNEKKKRIRQLEEKLKNRDGQNATPGQTRSAYDQDTEDEQDDSPNEELREDSSQEVVAGSDNNSRPVTRSNNLLKPLTMSYSSESEQDDIVLKYQETQDSLDSKMEEEEDPDLFSE